MTLLTPITDPEGMTKNLARHEVGHLLGTCYDRADVAWITAGEDEQGYYGETRAIRVMQTPPGPLPRSCAYFMLGGIAATLICDDRCKFPPEMLLKGGLPVGLAIIRRMEVAPDDLADMPLVTEAHSAAACQAAYRFMLMLCIAHRRLIDALADRVLLCVNQHGKPSTFQCPQVLAACGDVSNLWELSRHPAIFNDDESIKNIIAEAEAVKALMPPPANPHLEKIAHAIAR